MDRYYENYQLNSGNHKKIFFNFRNNHLRK